jgi:hypothetical protein
MCARNMGAHVQHSIQSTKGMERGLEIGFPCSRERCKETSIWRCRKILEKESSNKDRETCEKTMFTPSNPFKATNPIVTT